MLLETSSPETVTVAPLRAEDPAATAESADGRGGTKSPEAADVRRRYPPSRAVFFLLVSLAAGLGLGWIRVRFQVGELHRRLDDMAREYLDVRGQRKIIQTSMERAQQNLRLERAHRFLVRVNPAGSTKTDIPVAVGDTVEIDPIRDRNSEHPAPAGSATPRRRVKVYIDDGAPKAPLSVADDSLTFYANRDGRLAFDREDGGADPLEMQVWLWKK